MVHILMLEGVGKACAAIDEGEEFVPPYWLYHGMIDADNYLFSVQSFDPRVRETFWSQRLHLASFPTDELTYPPIEPTLIADSFIWLDPITEEEFRTFYDTLSFDEEETIDRYHKLWLSEDPGRKLYCCLNPFVYDGFRERLVHLRLHKLRKELLGE